MKSILLYLVYFLIQGLNLFSVELKESRPIKLMMFNFKYNYGNAHQLCETFGYKLIRIENEYSFNVINNLTELFNVGKYWLDANDIRNEGVFVHSDGSSMKYRKFDVGQPDNMGGAENCVEGLFLGRKVMNDNVCSILNGVICYKGALPADIFEIANHQGTFIVSKYKINFEEKRQFNISDGLSLMRNNVNLIYQQMMRLAEIFEMKNNGKISYSINGEIDFKRF